MTLIRASFAQRAVRPFDGEVAGPAPAPETDPRDLEIARLKEELARTNAALSNLQATFEEAVAAAEERALRAARAERTTAEAEQLQALEDAVRVAAAQWTERLQSLEPLAVGVAGAVLDSIFGSADWAAEHLAAAARQQLERLGESSTLNVRVSPADCPDGQFDQQLGGTVLIDPTLAKGEVRIGLRLGEIDASPSAQWQQASERLRHYLNEVLGGD